jgi:hypothetical protein
MNDNILKSIIELLKRNKEFPNYQAERRIDIFVNHFLERILSKYLNKKITYRVPEFPLKKSDNLLSTKVDYLCYSEDEIYFIELKTDKSSINTKQIEIYFNNLNWQNCISNFEKIFDAKRSKEYQEKYIFLKKEIDKIENIKKIRVIYLSPLSEKQYEKIDNYLISNRKKLHELDLYLLEEEKYIWDFLCEIELQIFEVNKETK